MANRIFSFFKQNSLPYEVTDAEARNSVNRINDEIDTINEKIGNINSNERYYLCIGDSYSVTQPNLDVYWDVCQKELGIDDEHWLNNSVVGFGLGDGSWLNKFSEWVTNNPTKLDKITDVFIMGGYNDAGYDTNTLISALQSLVNSIKHNLPNVKNIYTCCFGWSASNGNARLGIATSVRPAYRYGVNFGCISIDDLEYVFHDYLNYQSDGVHPNELAHLYCGKLLASFLKGHSCKPYHPKQMIGVNWTGMLPSNSSDILGGQNGDMVILEFKYTATWTAYARLANLVPVGTIISNSNFIHGTGYLAENIFINGQAGQIIINDLTIFLRLPSNMVIEQGTPFNISGTLYIPCDYT